MNKTIYIFLVTVFLSSSTQAYAGFAKLPVTSLSWASTWHGKNGGFISIRKSDGFLDISMVDSHTVTTAVCLIDKVTNRSAKCVGEGMNYKGEPARFLYQSTLKVNELGQLHETWEAFFSQGKINGKGVFEKKSTK